MSDALMHEFQELALKVESQEIFPDNYNHSFGTGEVNEYGEGDKPGYRGLYLQATKGDCPEKNNDNTMEGTFDYKAWKICKGMTKEEAAQKYIDFIHKIIADPANLCQENENGGYGGEDE